MKKVCLIVFLLTSIFSYSQNALYDTIHLTIAPNVNQQDDFNQKIIATLKLFLNSKDSSYTENKYWSKSDFEKYFNPYSDLEGIDAGRLGKHYYQPSLMEIIETDQTNRKIVKIAFIGHNEETKANLIKAIYNVVATKQDERIVFSMYLDYVTKDWKEFKRNDILYKISPCRTINKNDVTKQNNAIINLCKFLNTKPIPITYYSCTSPKELFKLLGFDYHPNLYNDTSGGWSREKDIVISANKSEYYMHEVTHIYLRSLFPSINAFFNEGFATYVGGSGKYDYKWQRNKLLKFLNENPYFKFDEHIDDPYERLYYEHETPIPYLIGALVCNRTLRLYGKEKLFELFRSDKNVFDTLKMVGLTKENINKELRKEIKLPPTLRGVDEKPPKREAPKFRYRGFLFYSMLTEAFLHYWVQSRDLFILRNSEFKQAFHFLRIVSNLQKFPGFAGFGSTIGLALWLRDVGAIGSSSLFICCSSRTL